MLLDVVASEREGPVVLVVFVADGACFKFEF